MSGYELSVGGAKGDSSATVYDNLLDLNIAENPTSTGSWDVELPYDRSFEDTVMADIYVYYDNSVIFRGILESVESSFDSSSTTLSGRGVTVDLRYQADSITYSSTTVYDALVDYWTNRTNYDVVVRPPNRDFLDGEYTTTQDLAEIFRFDSSKNYDLEKEQADVDRSKLYPFQLNFTEDASTSTMTTDTGYDVSNTSYSLDTAVRIDDASSSPNGYVQYSYTTTDDLNYSNTDYRWYVRLQSSTTSATLNFYIDGTKVRSWDLSSESISHQWLDVLNDSALTTENSAPSSLSGDVSVDVEVTGLSSGEWVDIDAMSVTDERFGSYTLPSSPNADNVYEGPEWYPNNLLIDGEPDPQIGTGRETSSATDWIGMVVETIEPVSELTAGMTNIDSGELVEKANTYDNPRTTHWFDFRFSNTGTEFAQRVYCDGIDVDTQSSSGETVRQEFARFEIFAPDESQFFTIDSNEFTGTKFEILEELHELGKYRFTLTDYANKNAESFPRETISDEPQWRIKSESRKLDYTAYANKVTVHGKTQSDGTYNSATVSDSEEINVVGRTVHKFEKNPDVVTQAEVDSRAQALLDEKTKERDESGSMDVVPQDVDVGFTYPIAPWSDGFRYGGRVGKNALKFRGSDGDPDKVEWDSGGIEVYTDEYTWEFLLHPQGLKELADDEYMVVLSGIQSSVPQNNDFVVLYGDGSVEVGFGTAGSGTSRVRSRPGIVNDRESQRLSLVWGIEAGDTWDVFVDGVLEDHLDEPSSPHSIDNQSVTYTLGVDTSDANPYRGGLDDVRLFMGEGHSQSRINNFTYEDLIEHPDANLENCPYYLRFDDRSDTSTATMDYGATYFDDSPDASVTGAYYEASFGRLEELQYSLGDDGNLSLSFDISGRIDTELIKIRNAVRSNQKNL
jgi:hypothetical protein